MNIGRTIKWWGGHNLAFRGNAQKTTTAQFGFLSHKQLIKHQIAHYIHPSFCFDRPVRFSVSAFLAFSDSLFCNS